MQYGTAVGGAGPKAVISTRDKEYVAKFSLNTDLYNIVKAEFIAMGLARIVGLVVSSVKLKTALNMSQIKVFLAAASDFKLSAKVAKEIVEHQSELIEKNGEKVCDEAKLPTLERQMFWGCQSMNPYTAE